MNSLDFVSKSSREPTIERALESAGVSSKIRIPNPQELDGYLSKHPDMLALVVEGCRRASEQFDRDSELSLEVYHDPEIPDEYIALYVRMERYDISLLDSLDAVMEPLEPAFADISGWFHVSTDFRPKGGLNAV